MQETSLALSNMFNLLDCDLTYDLKFLVEKTDFRKYLNVLIEIENSFFNVLTD
jgi:hypothetical protein